MFAGKVAGPGLQTVKLIVLARLLIPEDFGLFGIVTLAMTALETLTQSGFQGALMQKRDSTEAYLDTAWTVQAVRGFVLAGILLVTTPLFAWFFEEPRVVPLLRAAFQHVAQLRPPSLPAERAVQPGACSRASRIRAVAARVGIVWFIATRVGQAILDRVLGAGALGIYTMAHQIADLAATHITHLANSVTMPIYDKLQRDRLRLGEFFLQVFELIMSLTISLTAFLIVAAPRIVRGLLGPQWEAAILPLRILALSGFLRAVAATGGPLFIGAGEPHKDFWIDLGPGIVVVATYPLTWRFGVPGTGGGVVPALAATMPAWARVRRTAGVSWVAIVRACGQGLLLSAFVVVVALGIGRVVPNLLPLPALILQGVRSTSTSRGCCASACSISYSCPTRSTCLMENTTGRWAGGRPTAWQM
ncbi:MAG: oligosaccharide flippase family protein [Dehalococcoidia bacterium]|nr:oligosaccharide flippase family protein [Dehalococcoidia bacterium]